MTVNSAFASQGTSTPAPGGYAQPSTGITEQIVTPADPNGLAYQTYAPAGATAGWGNLQTQNYRDGTATVQAGSTASAPSAAGTVVSITPGAAGLWEIAGTFGINGTTVSTADSNNIRLMVGAGTAITPITVTVPSTTGTGGVVTIPPTIQSIASGATTVQIQAVGNATSGSVYAATLVARRVG